MACLPLLPEGGDWKTMGLAVESRARYLSSLGLFLPLAIGTCSFLSLAPEVSFPFRGCPSVDLLWASATVTLRHPDCVGMTAMETQQERTQGPEVSRPGWRALGLLSLSARSATIMASPVHIYLLPA